MCEHVEGQWFLAVDMRLQCFTQEWLGYAIYGAIMAVVYVFGLPAVIFSCLWMNRKTLYGKDSAATLRKYGFLYDTYGPAAWFWEVEELLRRLLLTAIAVLLDPGSPVQIALAVMYSG